MREGFPNRNGINTLKWEGAGIEWKTTAGNQDMETYLALLEGDAIVGAVVDGVVRVDTVSSVLVTQLPVVVNQKF